MGGENREMGASKFDAERRVHGVQNFISIAQIIR